ncbi:MAG: SDR family oxidoreductase [Spongiibacteraceae bacterium]
MQFKNKVVLITGGGAGIGAGVASMFHAQGATVVIGDINKDAGDEVCQSLKHSARSILLDVRQEDHWKSVIEEIERSFGQLDVLVQSAGISRPASIEDASLDDWREHMTVHGEGSFLGCKYAVASMKKTGGGSIVNISSVESIRPGPAFVCYGAAKAAQDAITKTVALHCGEMGYGIRCNSVHPAATYTPMLEQYLQNAEDPVALEKIYAGMQPLNRIATVEEVAATVVFLASDQASFITGHQMYVDGGVLAKPYPLGQGA